MSTHQGQGAGTRRKEDGYAALFEQSLYISTAEKCRLWPYHAIDLNSGCGFNDAVDCDGSPVVFLKKAAEVCRAGPLHAYFCDINPDAIRQLYPIATELFQQLHDAHLTVKVADNAEFLREVEDTIRAVEPRPQCAIGHCLCDPNGFRNGFPVDALRHFAHVFPRIDIIINFNLTLFKTVGGCKTSPNLPQKQVEGFRLWPTIPEIIESLGRPHWMIRNPPPLPRHRFTQVIGRTLETARRPFKGFYPLDSPEGQRILNRLGRINPDQGLLFEGME